MSWFHLPLYGKSVPTSTQKFNLLPIIVLENKRKVSFMLLWRMGRKNKLAKNIN